MINIRVVAYISFAISISTSSIWAHSAYNPDYVEQRNQTMPPAREQRSVEVPQVTSQRNFIGNANTTTDVEKLQSRPGMPFVIYLWFNPDKNASDEVKRTVWEQTADDWIMFNVNVTTDETIFESKAIDKRIKCRFTTYFASGGGSYDEETGERTAIVNMDQDPEIVTGREDLLSTPSHEMGHTFDLMHDTDNYPYYKGHGEYGAIMGGSGGPVIHWSKGEYKMAGNREDDIAIIGDVLGFVDDDKPEPVNLVVESNGDVQPEKNNGTITAADDIDIFRITLDENATVT